MNVFYCSEIDNEIIALDESESLHATRVLRLLTGDKICILDGKGKKCIAEIVNPHHKKCECKIIEQAIVPPKTFHLHIAIAPTKMNDRMEWFLEKATEIGIDEITPVICNRSERRQTNHDRFEKVLIAAMKQSMNPWLPILNPQIDFNKFIELHPNGFIAHCNDSPKHPLKEKLPAKGEINLLIGPEGDFTMEEVNLAALAGWIPVSLGESRLRTETAGVVACHTVNLLQS